MKKILSTIIIAVVLLSGFYITLYAAFSANVIATADKDEVNPGDTVAVTVKVKDINEAGTGISAIEGYLEYDNTFFEDIKAEDMETATLNPTTGQFVWMGLATSEKDIAKINLKVKSDATGSGNLAIKNIALSTGDTEDITSPDISLDIAIASATGGDDNNTTGNSTTGNNTTGNNTTGNSTTGNNTTGNNTTGNNTTKNNTTRNNTTRNNTTKNNTTTPGSKDNTTSGNRIPNAGVKATVMGLILVLAVVSGVAYMYYKRYEKI